MYCRSCGAQLNDQDTQCAYCGAYTAEGAQKEYMDSLHEIREQTEDLADTPKEVLAGQMKSHGRFTIKIASIVVGVCLGIMLLIVGIGWLTNQSEKKDAAKRAEFREEYFPKLDALYEAGDDQAVYEYLMELYEEDDAGALSYWEHEAFYYYYGEHLEWTQFRAVWEADPTFRYEATWALYTALDLAHNGISDWDRQKLNKSETETVNGYVREAKALLNDIFGIPESEIPAAYEACCDDGYLDYDKCESYAKEKLQ